MMVQTKFNGLSLLPDAGMNRFRLLSNTNIERRIAMGDKVLIEKNNKVFIIKLNAPNKRNALEKALRDDLKEALRKFQNNSESQVAVITGEGKAFCGGGDVEAFKNSMDPVKAVNYMSDNNDITLLITTISKPIIAAVNGAAVGAGFSLAMACDIIMASTNAVFSLAFANMGLVPGMGSLYYLPRLVGMHRAKELIYTGRIIKAEEALQLGIANYVVAPEELEARVLELATKIADGPAVAYGLGKAILSKSFESALPDILQFEAYAQSICMQSKDHKEGVKAFYEKRSPQFEGK